MPRQYFPYYHPCVVRAVLPRLSPTPFRELQTPEIPELPLPDIDLVPAELSSDDSIIGLPILEACLAMTRRQALEEPTTPKGRPIPV